MRMTVVGAIILKEDGQVLLAERPPGKKLAGHWEFPGGKVEIGETPENALKRELKEELHLDVEVERKLGTFPYEYPWGEIDLYVYVVRAKSTPKPSADVLVFHWVKIDQVKTYKLSPADIEPWSRYIASSPKTETV